jgi:glycosyltransferase involved in cell wall biosynthesis
MLIQGYYPLLGGAERQLGALAPRLQARGVDVSILTRRYAGLPAFERIDGVPVYRLPIPGPKAVASATYTLASMRMLRRVRPDVVHAHELLSPATTAVLAKQLLRLPIAVKLLRGGVLGDIAAVRRKPFAERRLTAYRREVDAFITISREIDAELAEAGVDARRRAYIPNGIDVERFAPALPPEKVALRDALGLPDVPVVLFAGRLAPEKRVDQLIGIWDAVRDRHGDALLVILGTGPEATTLQRAAGAGVRFVGLVDDVERYLRAADVFVLPSVAEGLSGALLEAMASGLPVIATSVGGATDLICHEHNGWLLPPDDPPMLLEALLCVLSNTDRRRSMGQLARAQIEQHYALDVTADRLVSLYGQLRSRQAPDFNRRFPMRA